MSSPSAPAGRRPPSRPNSRLKSSPVADGRLPPPKHDGYRLQVRWRRRVSDPRAAGVQLTQRQPELTRHDNQQPHGVIADAQYERLSPDEQSKFARVKRGQDGGSQWVERAKLPSETAAANGTKQPDGSNGDPAAANPGQASVTADGKLKVGDLELAAKAGPPPAPAIALVRKTGTDEA
jgi:hypothetical protein